MSVPHKRLLVLAAFLVTWALVIVARMVQIQIVRHDDYVVRAARQQQRTVKLSPVRGAIRDRHGRLLAESVAAESIYADPQAIGDYATAAKRLAAVPGLGVAERDLLRKLKGRGEFTWIARQVAPEVARAVRDLDIHGIYMLEEHRRSYPKGQLAANLIGYVGVDGEGLAGVEHSFDKYARGRAGTVTLLRDARRGMYMVGGEGPHAPANGSDVILSIDEVIQFVSERALDRAITQYRASGGAVVVMDPRDGAVLAMASRPTFDPNRFRDFPAAAWRNRVVQDIYEPGSTFKIVTAAAGLEEGVVTPSQVIDCGDGSIQIAHVKIREHGGNQYGLLPFFEVLAQSSNVGSIKVGLSVGAERFYEYIRRFGFGRRSGVELPGEVNGIVRSTDKWSQLSNAVISIGQEIGATPIQVLQAACTVANGGRRLKPRIVERVVDSADRTVYTPQASPPERVISEKTAAVLNEILKGVVRDGTGGAAAVPDHVVAGKTGTAQKAVRGGYSPDRFVASFVGYVPADRPQLAILVVVDEPRLEQYGGVVAAPAFAEVAEASLRYLGVKPSMPTREIRLDRLAKLTPGPVLRNAADARTSVARATAAAQRRRQSDVPAVAAIPLRLQDVSGGTR